MTGNTPPAWEQYGRVATRDGLVAGLLGGVTLAVFFLIVDWVRGDPTRTVGSLASAVFALAPEGAAASHILGFLALHLAVFAGVGVGAVWLFRLTGTPENTVLGALYGLVVATLLFYLTLVLSDVDMLGVPAWPWVLLGNLLAGGVMGGYLQRVGPLPGHVSGVSLVRVHPVLREGLITGALGAVAVAGWFLAVDVVMGRPSWTPALLGSILFLGADGAQDVLVSANVVLGYAAIHLAVFLVLGAVLVGSVTGMEKYPGLLAAIALFLVFLGVAFVGVVVVMGTWILHELIWPVLVGNVLATVVMGGYLWRVHPLLRARLRDGMLWRDL